MQRRVRNHRRYYYYYYCHFLTDDSLQSADKDQQERRAVAKKLHDAAVNFDAYRNSQRHRAAIARLACNLTLHSALIL